MEISGHYYYCWNGSFVVQIVNDVKFTVNQAVEPVEKGITKFNEKLHKIKDRRKTKDDSCIATATAEPRVIRGIDDPLLNGSMSDSAVAKGKKHCKKSGSSTSGESGDSSCYLNSGGYLIRGRRWVTKD